jgi:tetratricopeptide (TPR) repeat protein
LEDSGYRVQASALDPVTGKPVAEATQSFREKAGFLQAVDRLASVLRAGLGDAEPESRLSFAKETFTTASLDAMHAYAIGQNLLLSGRYEESIEEYQKAISFDAEFGRAYAGVGVALWNLDRMEEAQPHFDRALALIHRMSDRERLRTRGVYYLFIRNYPQALDEFTQLVTAFPSDATGLSNLASCISMAAISRRRSMRRIART